MATVIDCHNKEVIGWAAGDNYKTPLIEQAIEMAARNHLLLPGSLAITRTRLSPAGDDELPIRS